VAWALVEEAARVGALDVRQAEQTADAVVVVEQDDAEPVGFGQVPVSGVDGDVGSGR
jgi:hypothetical protein